MKTYNIAIVGATGLVGQTFLKVMDEYKIPINQLSLFASEKSKGKEIVFQDQTTLVQVIEPGVFKGVDFVLFSAGSATSLQYAKQAVEEGAIVIDNSSAWRMNDQVPLVVPEVNFSDALNQKLIANPNCSTIQSVLPLKVLDDAYQLQSVEYHTYQAVSGAGVKGIQALEDGAYFPYDIRETCIPQIDEFMDDGYTFEEYKMMFETKKILQREDLLISATCVRVPVKTGHGVSMRVVLNHAFELKDIRQLLLKSPGIVLLDEPGDLIYPTSIHAKGRDDVYVGRLRRDMIHPNGLLMYVVADNIRKGAASNAVQIMKRLMENENTF